MSSVIEGYNYDIFISYRQKDNKGSRWVSTFVDALKTELESTFKENISIYFDENPVDGLQETHHVDKSLEGKLKCLIFIPILSKTYCDPNSFAWQNEFIAFNKFTKEDFFGRDIRLRNGNYASRILPVRIHDLDPEDLKLFENETGSILRALDFVFRTASGVSRPLKVNEDHPHDNVNKTFYSDQVNKVGQAIRDIIQGIREGKASVDHEQLLSGKEPVVIKRKEFNQARRRSAQLSWKTIVGGIIIITGLTLLVTAMLKLFAKESNTDLNSEEVLNKAISFCDPINRWGNYNGKVHLINVQLGEIIADEIIEIQTGENYYRCSSVLSDGTSVVKGIIDGRYFREINGKKLSGEEINTKDIDWWKQWHYSHFGLLMELKVSGMILGKKVKVKKFDGEDCLAIDFSCDSSKLKNSFFKGTAWIIFLDPGDYSIKGLEAKGLVQINGYSIYSGTLGINGINIPMVRSYYSSIDSTFVGIDLFIKAK